MEKLPQTLAESDARVLYVVKITTGLVVLLAVKRNKNMTTVLNCQHLLQGGSIYV